MGNNGSLVGPVGFCRSAVAFVDLLKPLSSLRSCGAVGREHGTRENHKNNNDYWNNISRLTDEHCSCLATNPDMETSVVFNGHMVLKLSNNNIQRSTKFAVMFRAVTEAGVLFSGVGVAACGATLPCTRLMYLRSTSLVSSSLGSLFL